MTEVFFLNVLDPNLTDGFDFPVDSWVVRWNKIKDMITSNHNDIGGLVEVPILYRQEITNDLKYLGYLTFFCEKLNSTHGCLLFWKNNKALKTWMVHLQVPLYPTASQVALFVQLSGGSVIAVTHLKSTKTSEGEKIRVQQIEMIINELKDIESVVLMGDLNSSPIEHNGYAPLVYPIVTSSGYVDAHPQLGFSTWKSRKGIISKMREDYILVKGLKINSSSVVNTKSLLPNEDIPSDHLPIKALIADRLWYK